MSDTDTDEDEPSNLEEAINQLEEELGMTDSEIVRETGRSVAHLQD